MIKQSIWLIEQRARDMNYLEHLKYQLQYFEKKTWEIIESRDLMSQEIFNRIYQFHARQVKELLEEQAEIIDDLGIINISLRLHEELVWQEVENKSLFLKHISASLFSPFLYLSYLFLVHTKMMSDFVPDCLFYNPFNIF